MTSHLQDFGYPQETTTDVLRAYVTNSIQGAQPKRSTTMTSILPYKNTSISASGANRSVAGDNFDKEELFVDLFEYVNVIFDGSVCLIFQEYVPLLFFRLFTFRARLSSQ
jgi:hypothetical protein